MKIQSFIFIHDENILKDMISRNRFQELPNMKYVFLGPNPINKFVDNIIIARDLIYNIEQYPKLTTFTGWYCLWKNNLIDQDTIYIHLFEFDVIINQNLLNNNDFEDKDVIGYVKWHPKHMDGIYLKCKKHSEELYQSILKHYHIDIRQKYSNKDDIISMTSNHTFKKHVFQKYMGWMMPILEDIKNLQMGGHQFERSISVFYLIHNLSYKIRPNCLHHFQLDTHNTQNMYSNERYQDFLKKGF